MSSDAFPVIGTRKLELQWNEAKAQNPDALLFFLIGGYYELLGEDARVVARECGRMLTTLNRADALHRCSVPERDLTRHITTLLSRGFNVAVCEVKDGQLHITPHSPGTVSAVDFDASTGAVGVAATRPPAFHGNLRVNGADVEMFDGDRKVNSFLVVGKNNDEYETDEEMAVYIVRCINFYEKAQSEGHTP